MKLLLFILLILTQNVSATVLNDRGLFCKLDNNDSKNVLFEAFLFEDKNVVSLFLDINQNTVVIKRSNPEKFIINYKYIKIRGINIDKKKLYYKTMGGIFYCQMISKKLLINTVEKMKINKIKRMKKIF